MDVKVFVERIVSFMCHKIIIAIASIIKSRGYVFMIHSVGGNGNYEYDISREEFEQFLCKIKNYPIIRLEEWESYNNFIVLTADDVHESFYRNAFPLLKKYRIPFTIFVSTSLIDTKGYISSNQLIEMSMCELCTIGSHGHSHSMYKKFTKDTALHDLEMSKKRLLEVTGRDIQLYAYPYGSYFACGYNNKRSVQQVYKYGFGTIKCPITRPLIFSKYFLPRINVDVELLRSL